MRVRRLDLGNRWRGRTLWLREDTLFNTGLQSSVEQGVEHVIGDGDLVVGLDILLQGDTAGKWSARGHDKHKTRRIFDSIPRSRRDNRNVP